uniref:Uncharacterized protein n=1 Tax=Octopus bimaculoides TaxID=37653 RepID=A0A0L8I205_OCTBM
MDTSISAYTVHLRQTVILDKSAHVYIQIKYSENFYRRKKNSLRFLKLSISRKCVFLFKLRVDDFFFGFTF